MKPIKQTVYLPVNGEPEINTVVHQTGEYIEGVEQQELFIFTPEQLNEYTQNIIKQALEIAAKNTGFVETTSEKLNSEDYKPFITADDNTLWTIDKQSITNTFEETFKRFRV